MWDIVYTRRSELHEMTVENENRRTFTTTKIRLIYGAFLYDIWLRSRRKQETKTVRNIFHVHKLSKTTASSKVAIGLSSEHL